MLEHLDTFKEALIQEFYQLYDRYQDDQIYACSLIFNKFLIIEDLVLSTEKSICNADEEDLTQYLAPQERWETQKWRYRASANPQNSLKDFHRILARYFQSLHSFGNPLLENNPDSQLNHLKVLINMIQIAKQQLQDEYGLDIEPILFFVTVPQQPEFEIYSAQLLNANHPLLVEFIQHKMAVKNTVTVRKKLSQSDKDILTDVAQLVEIEPYDYMKVAHEAYLLTLEPHFIDCHPSIQQFIHTIAAMVSDNAGLCAMSKDEILQRIEQFYPHQQQSNKFRSINQLISETPITLAFIDRI